MNGYKRNAAFFFICVLIMLTNQNVNAVCESKNPNIVIVGAGAAGIAAASKLLDNGFSNVKILEAENRMGGRVYSTKFGDYNVDLGGQWVHGEKGNVAFNLAYPLGLLDKNDDPGYGIEQKYVDSRGNWLSDNLIKNITSLFYNCATENDTKKIYESFGDCIEKRFDDKFKKIPEIYSQRTKFLNYLELDVSGDTSADSWNDVEFPAITRLFFRDCEGDIRINWKKRSYSMILDILMKRYPNPKDELPVMNNTFFNSEVTSIDYESSPIKITTAQGQLYYADHVIVTIPLGVLKAKYESLFTPALPDYKIETIKGLGYGSIAKIYLVFDRPFWHNGKESKQNRIQVFPFIWNDDDRKTMEHDQEKSWLLGVSDAHTVEYKPNLLAMFVGQKYARAMEALPEEKVFDHSMENLHRFLGKQFEITKPIAMLRTQWYSNPHFRGTYSYRNAHTYLKNVSSRTLEQPVSVDNLAVLFAGEATSYDRYATVDGAIASGWRAADRLIKCYTEHHNN